MKKFLLVLCSLYSIASFAGVNIQHWTAPSGARVYFVATRDLPMLDVQVDFAAGSVFDPAGKSGLAGLTTGLLDAGAKVGEADLNEEQLAVRLADIGARMSGAADDDRASIHLRTLSAQPQRGTALDLLRAELAAPSFPDSVLAREKTRSIAAIQEADTQPDSIAAKRFAAAIYPGHPYGASASADSVGRITRDDLLTFWRDHFGARHAVVSIIGDVSRTEAEQIAAHLTDALPQPPAGVTPPLPEVTLPQRQTIRLPHPAAQSHIYIGMPAVKRGDADYFPLLVGNYVLGGGGFVSRLMQEVRVKRGYAYSVYSYFAPRMQPGPFQIGLQTKRAQTNEALQVVETTLGNFLRQGPSETELKAAKQNLVDGMALRLDSNAKILGYLSLIGFYGLPLTYIEDFPKRIESVTPQQVRAAFARHVQPEHLVTVIVAGD
ncbi:MAG: insulinase family protein [Betaproteobacteria bacterium]|nr:insulinase family protein [Betaproteobacteria bacterium]